jgi:hypothetical protein
VLKTASAFVRWAGSSRSGVYVKRFSSHITHIMCLVVHKLLLMDWSVGCLRRGVNHDSVS